MIKEWKSELEKVEFDIFRIENEIKMYVKRCELLGFEWEEERIDKYLDILSELRKKREKLIES